MVVEEVALLYNLELVMEEVVVEHTVIKVLFKIFEKSTEALRDNFVAAAAIVEMADNIHKKAIVDTFGADKKLDHVDWKDIVVVDFDLNFDNYFCGSFLNNYP